MLNQLSEKGPSWPSCLFNFIFVNFKTDFVKKTYFLAL